MSIVPEHTVFSISLVKILSIHDSLHPGFSCVTVDITGTKPKLDETNSKSVTCLLLSSCRLMLKSPKKCTFFLGHDSIIFAALQWLLRGCHSEGGRLHKHEEVHHAV